MDFTEIYKQTGHCVFSPNGLYIATAVQYRLCIRDSETLAITHLYSCTDGISEVKNTRFMKHSRLVEILYMYELVRLPGEGQIILRARAIDWELFKYLASVTKVSSSLKFHRMDG